MRGSLHRLTRTVERERRKVNYYCQYTLVVSLLSHAVIVCFLNNVEIA